MQEIIEQKGKPCCINMISSSDKEYLGGLEKIVQRERRTKLREEHLLSQQHSNQVTERHEPKDAKAKKGKVEEKTEEQLEQERLANEALLAELESSEEEVDEIEQLIQK